MARVVKRPTTDKVDPPPEQPVVQWPPFTQKTYDLDLLRGAKRHPLVLGIDCSAEHPAIAAFSLDDGTAFAWVADIKTKGVRRLVDIETWAHRTLTQIKLRSETVEHIAMENYSFGSTGNLTMLGECGGTLKRELLKVFGARNKVAYPTLATPSQLKKFVVGSAGTPKEPVKKQQMLLATYKKWGVDINDDNACDAYGLTRVAQAVHTGDAEHAYEREVLAKLEPHTEWPER